MMRINEGIGIKCVEAIRHLPETETVVLCVDVSLAHVKDSSATVSDQTLKNNCVQASKHDFLTLMLFNGFLLFLNHYAIRVY